MSFQRAVKQKAQKKKKVHLKNKKQKGKTKMMITYVETRNVSMIRQNEACRLEERLQRLAEVVIYEVHLASCNTASI